MVPGMSFWSCRALPTRRQVMSQPPPAPAGAMHSVLPGWKAHAGVESTAMDRPAGTAQRARVEMRVMKVS